jgi:hypothetical protein
MITHPNIQEHNYRTGELMRRSGCLANSCRSRKAHKADDLLPKRETAGSTKARRPRVRICTMDAAEYEGDVQLQKAASGLLADFETSLQPFLWRTLDSGKLRIRRRVRVREKDRLLRLVCWTPACSYPGEN